MTGPQFWEIFYARRDINGTLTNMFTKIKMGKNFHGTVKLLLCTQFIRGRETKTNRKLQRNFSFIVMWQNIFGNPGWRTKRLVIISQGTVSVPSGV
jgi:hypothetical protein